MFAGLVACNQNQKQNLEDAEDDIGDLARQVSDDFQDESKDPMTTLEEYDKRLDRKLDELEKQVDSDGENAGENLEHTKKDLKAWSKEVKQ